MGNSLSLFLLSSITLQGCNGKIQKEEFISNNELNLLVIGDWGGKSSPPYYTASQKLNAEGMAKIAEITHPQAVISLGDNFYSVGLSEENVEERYKATFEDVI